MTEDNSSAPLLSVVIPTKNRYATLNEILGVILSLPDPDFEVVLQDCSDGMEEFNKISQTINDPRLKCYKSPSHISMTDNWNHALPHIRGEYAIFIGDDDLVGHDIMNVVRWAHANDVDAVSCVTSGSAYFWRDYPIGSKAKTLKIKPCRGSFKYLDPVKEAIAGSHGIGTENFHRLPQIYHGLVRLASLKKMPDLSGKFFDGVAPDYYASFALAFTVKKFCVIDYSFVIVGASARSNTARATVQRLLVSQHWDEYELKSWPGFIPQIKMHYTLIAESMIRAFINSGRHDLINNINVWKLFSLYIIHNPLGIVKILSNVKCSAQLLDRSISFAFFSIFGYLLQKVFYKLFKFRSAKNSFVIDNVDSISEAYQMHRRHFPNITGILNRSASTTL